MDPLTLKDDQNKRYAATIAVFAALVFAAYFALRMKFGDHGALRIPPFHMLVLALAVFRLVRLFHHDLIMRVLRDSFSDLREVAGEDGETYVERSKPKAGLKRSLYDLFSCPWCLGIWVSYFTVLIYFFVPGFMFVGYVLALAGVGSVIEIASDLLIAKSKIANEEKNDVLIRTRGL